MYFCQKDLFFKIKGPTINSLYKYAFTVHQRRHLCKLTGLTNYGTAGNPNKHIVLCINAAQKDIEHGCFFLMTNNNKDSKTHRTQIKEFQYHDSGCQTKLADGRFKIYLRQQFFTSNTVKLQNSLLKDTGSAKNLDSESNSMCSFAAQKPFKPDC